MSATDAPAAPDALDPNSAKHPVKMENTEKRDTLMADEVRFQKEWEESKVFYQNAPAPGEDKDPKFFGTMAYPYMNGTLHAGHAFTMSKVEFMTGFARMEGKRALFPQGYHCTGMPIKAAADKLAREVELFGPTFEGALAELSIEDEPAPTSKDAGGKTDMGKFSSSKSKAAAKTGKVKYQFQIMLSLGIPVEDIQKFANPLHWLTVFPEKCEADLRAIGARVDWRRSMVTTPANPFYDAFVRWQMNRLKGLGKIKFGKRYTVYSPKDGQACLDHDRSAGEGVTVQEYVALKMKTLEWAPKAKEIIGDKIPADADVYFVPATLRPETMYGQTCCFVGPKVQYGIYKNAKSDGKDEYYFCSERSARNMAFQNIFPIWGEFPKIVDLVGSDVVGSLVDAPLSVHSKGIRILPMETVKPTKGTGVVTCVPSDSPDDYATTLELRKKAAYYGIDPEWVANEIIPIIKTPTSDLIAKHLYETMKIQSPKDTAKLAEAKEQAYKEGFYQGTMLIGEYKGLSVEDAKPLIKKKLIDAGIAFAYGEPDGMVISRSSDECVAAYLDQWYFNYGTTEKGGDGAWCNQVLEALNSKKVRTFYPEAKNAFEQTLGWLAQWACSRSFGLGTKLPWDHTQLVESLSDSTVYMAYYTVSHFLHGDIFGQTPGLASKPITAEQMNDEVWDYIFFRSESVSSDIPQQDLDAMRREFSYWYPLDVRVSGKDLINNHLTFCLYHHAALFDEAHWPRGVRVNGHLMLNGEKMSKSTGNFLTLQGSVEKYGADATRIALADAGDGIEDANFEETVANAIILKLYELRKWCQDTVEDSSLRTGELNIFDKLFENEMSTLIQETRQQYENTFFKLALKSGFYDFTAARDWYREATKASGVGMHLDLVRRYVELQALLVTPLAPHFSEFLYKDVLKHKDSVQNALFPTAASPDAALTAAYAYIRTTTANITAAEGQQTKKIAKGKAVNYDPKQPKRLTIFVSTAFPAWQEKCVELVAESFKATGAVDVKSITGKIDKTQIKKAMPFIQNFKKRLESGGEDPSAVFDRKLAYDELATLKEMVPGLKQTVPRLESVRVVTVEEGQAAGKIIVGEGETLDSLPPMAAAANPGSPTFLFENI
ncbi:leucine--tRNA ligase [Microdochium nivale]|nr:leucine--tRNA ligase [Microdochium nivale]